MYYRSQGYRYPKNMRIPINYGGNAFSNAEITDTVEIASEASTQEDTSTEAMTEIPDIPHESSSDTTDEKAAPAASLFGGIGSSPLFGGRIGSEELLILALVFLLSDTDADSDIIWLLLLLLFIK